MKYLRKHKWFLFLYLTVAFFAYWYWHVDEHYQIFEFASYKLGYTPSENLPWEFHQKIRSGILPIGAYFISKILLFVSLFNPFWVETICRLGAGFLFSFVYLHIIDLFPFETSKEKKPFLILAAFFWFLPMVMTRYSSEAMSTILFYLGYLISLKPNGKSQTPKLIVIGLLMGLSFYIRFQIAVLIGIWILWLLVYSKEKPTFYVWIFTGFLLSTGVEFLTNYWLYHEWVWSPWKYFEANLIQDKASTFGLQPFYYYISELLKNLIFPLSLAILIGVIGYSIKNKKSIFTWWFWGFVLAHSLIPHKEYRFIFPVFPIMIPMAFYYLQQVLDQRNKWIKGLVMILVVVNFLLIPSNYIIQSFNAYNFKHIYPYTQRYNTLYTDTPCPYALSDRFYNVRPYFWKSPTCQVVEVDTMPYLESISNFYTKKDYGNTYIYHQDTLYKVFETMPMKYKSKLPESIVSTFEQNFFYTKK